MRKPTVIAALAAVMVLAIAAVAYAAQLNTYAVSGSTAPKTAGSKKSPKPIGIKFGFQVDEASGQRPSVVEKYVIKFAGTRVNTSVAANCKASVLEKQGPKACPRKSIVGSGYIVNQTGSTADPNDKSIHCNAALTVVNLGGGKASIYVQGEQNHPDERRRCDVQLNAGIPARFANTSSGSTLTFTVPETLRHPLPTLSNAVKSVESTIKKISKKGKGFYEATGCKSGKRDVTVTFRTEDGRTDRSTKQANC